MRSRFAVSSATPSLSTRPKVVQNVAYFSGSFAAEVVEQAEDALDGRRLMFWTSRDCCRISRETFSGRSLESMMPRTNRRYAGIRCSRVVHDEDAPDVELDAVALVAVPQVERRPLRDEEQLRVLLAALDLRVHAGQRRLEVVGDVLVELVRTARR